MRRIPLALNLVLAASLAAPALALSCLPPDPAATFARLDAAPEPYVVVHGALRFDEARLPGADMRNQAATPPRTRLPARLAGMALSRAGFDMPFDRQITLDVLCFGPWCGGARAGGDILAFVERRETGYVLTLDPCFGTAFAEPGTRMLSAVAACMRGGRCKAGGD